MHPLSVAYFKSLLLGEFVFAHTQKQCDDWKWATDKRCIHNKWLLKKSTLQMQTDFKCLLFLQYKKRKYVCRSRIPLLCFSKTYVEIRKLSDSIESLQNPAPIQKLCEKQNKNLLKILTWLGCPTNVVPGRYLWYGYLWYGCHQAHQRLLKEYFQ